MFYADTMMSDVKSIRSFKYAHLIRNGRGFSKFYPMTAKNQTIQSLDDFVHTYGIMDRPLTDRDPAMEDSKAWKKTAVSGFKKYTRSGWDHTCHGRIERNSMYARRNEVHIRRFTTKAGSPRRLWCFLGKLVCQL